MNYFLELVSSRESVRDYDPNRTVDESVLRRILEAGRLAPSAKNSQPWKFCLISTPAMLARVRAAYAGDWFRKAPHILVVIGDRNKAWSRQFDGYCSIEVDLTISMDHMILAAESEGVSTCWVAAFDPATLRQALELKANEVVFAMTPLGYPPSGFKKKANKQRTKLEDVVRYL